MQKSPVGRLNALTGPEEVVVPEYELRRQQTFGYQALRTIQIRQYRVQQTRPLSDPGG
ncbi:hypothetical protein D3C81_2114910 [compost metagenome]